EASEIMQTASICSGASAARCGDGHLDPGEACDSGGIDTATCDADCSVPLCGDGYVNTLREQCDTRGESPFCDADCTTAVCGDGHLNTQAGEQCDDGNHLTGDGCSDSCHLEPTTIVKYDVGVSFPPFSGAASYGLFVNGAHVITILAPSGGSIV